MPEQRIKYTSQGGALYEKITKGRNVTWIKNGIELVDAAYVSKRRALEFKEALPIFRTMRRDRGKAFFDSTLDSEDRDGYNRPGGIIVYIEGEGVRVGGPIISRDPAF